MNKKSKAMQEAHCHACQMTGFKQERERETEWCSMCLELMWKKETPPGDAPLSSSPYANRQSLCACVFVSVSSQPKVYTRS
jgi:hypothetical protein